MDHYQSQPWGKACYFFLGVGAALGALSVKKEPVLEARISHFKKQNLLSQETKDFEKDSDHIKHTKTAENA